MKSVLTNSSFEIIYQRKSGAGIVVIVQLINAHIFSLINKLIPSKYCFLVTNIFTFPINLLGYTFNFLLPQNDNLYLDNIVLSKKIKSI